MFLRGIRVKDEPDRSVFPFTIPALHTLSELSLSESVTFLVGENGSGKSTLIEALAVLMGMNAEGGSQNFKFGTRPSESPLHEHLVPIRSHRRPRRRFFLRAESLFNVQTEVEQRGLTEYGWEILHERSHGEAFLWLLQERFVEGGLYILDEPEAALSPKRQLAMIRRIDELVRGGSQLIIATHSPILMAYPGATIYSLDESQLRTVAYEETEHYVVTRDFLQSPGSFLRHLLEDDECDVSETTEST